MVDCGGGVIVYSGWWVVAHYGWRWLTVAGDILVFDCGWWCLALADSALLGLVMVGCGWCWLTVAGVGWLLQVLVNCGWCWLAVAGVG